VPDLRHPDRTLDLSDYGLVFLIFWIGGPSQLLLVICRACFRMRAFILLRFGDWCDLLSPDHHHPHPNHDERCTASPTQPPLVTRRPPGLMAAVLSPRRIQDRPGYFIRSAVREIVDKYRLPVLLSPDQVRGVQWCGVCDLVADRER